MIYDELLSSAHQTSGNMDWLL